MTTNNEMTAVEIIAAATAAAAARDAKALRSLWAAAQSNETEADRNSVTARMAAAVASGEVIAAAIICDTDAKQDLHTAPQLLCQTAAAAAGITVHKDHAKRLLRANLYCSDTERLNAAVAKLGAADGPKNSQMIEIVRYCQTQDSKGRAALGDKFSGLTAAAARKQVSKAAADTATATRTAATAVAAAAALKLGAEIIAANDDTSYAQLSAQRWAAMTVTSLDEIIATAQAVKAAKAKAAKDAKAKQPKGKQPKVTEQPAALVPGSDEFNAAVLAAVAQLTAAAQ